MNKALLDEALTRGNDTKRIGIISECLQAHDEETAAEIIRRNGNWGLYRSALLLDIFYDSFTDRELLFELIIDVYTTDGYNFTKSVMQTAKRIAKDIDPAKRLSGLPDGEVLTVYRGTGNLEENPKFAISWTLDLETAVFFAYRQMNPIVYRGTIKRDSIIAYTDRRGEKEIIQHGNVQNIERLDLTTKEVQQLRHAYADSAKQWNDQLWAISVQDQQAADQPE